MAIIELQPVEVRMVCSVSWQNPRFIAAKRSGTALGGWVPRETCSICFAAP